MPSCSELPDDFARPDLFGDSGVPRSPGLHLSTIIHDLGDSLGMEVPKPSRGLAPPKESWFEMGFTFERFLELAFGDRMGARPEEYVLDGIAGSPDGLGIDPETGRLCLEEYKCTTKTMKPITERWRWMMQVSGYCQMVGVNVVVFRVFWLCGDRRPAMPRLKAYRVEFTDAELERNWAMIVDHAKARGWLPE